MDDYWCMTMIFIPLFIATAVLAQKTAPVSTTAPPTKSRDFIEPKNLDKWADSFVFENYEYIFEETEYKHKFAHMRCKYGFDGATLAVIEGKKEANFLAEALSETNLEFDTLWTAGVLINPKKKIWQWQSGTFISNISTNIVDLIVEPLQIHMGNNCLGFSRADHDKPQFKALTCEARRAVMCRRSRRTTSTSISTHPGWIKLGKRHYKIYHAALSFHDADEQCFKHDQDAKLAVIINFEHCQKLGRYLLIGRPSLENAWIGAKYDGKQFVFSEENIFLSNDTNVTTPNTYPPWRNNTIQKPGGCLLLDRHIENITLFVEARCQRLRPYICYKIVRNETVNISTSDVIIGNNGYRLHFNKLVWERACAYCKDEYKDYKGKLVEIRDKKQVGELLHVMGENRSTVQHIWIGAKLSYQPAEPTWVWNSDSAAVDKGNLFMITNSSYENTVEEGNTCLNMDRENHRTALHYGTACGYPQSYVCLFPADELIKLQESERNSAMRDMEED